ncbi:hypothetical protein PMG11_01918 [Penicillium brasilianum]|uniref:CID domain-containing protein n=1 Tax=Penicillium brasilianum TaxID=104259 RepID=A0A0F7TGL0_PENBI|nr:hypothetical protein PMG11_01918 [Penicillium brasilianum]
MSTAAAELGRSLESMLALPPPGIAISKVNMIVSLCYLNIHDEVNLIEKIRIHFMIAPITHKVGVLYVIDSITRHWVEATRRIGRPPRNAAPDGRLAAGVDRITRSLPALMTDITCHTPLNQKVCTRILKMNLGRAASPYANYMPTTGAVPACILYLRRYTIALVHQTN